MSSLTVLNPDSRPRERLLDAGPQALTDAELLAIILGSGTRGMHVLDVAQAMLEKHRGLNGLARALLGELQGQAGIGPARSAAVIAAIEIGRRSVGQRPFRGQRITSADQVWGHVRARLEVRDVEEFWALALDVRHCLIWEECMARGSLTGVDVHPRDVFRRLIRGGAATVIFCHNHPSGDPSPSDADLDLTWRLCDVGELCGIPVLDHLIVGSEGYTSFARDYWTSPEPLLRSRP